MPSKPQLSKKQKEIRLAELRIKKHLPVELLEQEIWLAYYLKPETATDKHTGKPYVKYTKPPVKGYSVSEDLKKPTKSFDKVIKDGLPGIQTNPSNDIVAFDIDDLDLKKQKSSPDFKPFSISSLPQEFREWLSDKDAYTEISPSMCGARILFRCDEKIDLPGRGTLLKDKCIGGELFANSGYVTITGNHVSGKSIPKVSAKEIQQWIKQKEVIENLYKLNPATREVYKTTPERINRQHMPKLYEIEEALSLCKLDKNLAITEAYKSIMNQDYSHYDFWLKIMAACYDYGEKTDQLVEVLQHVITWSQTDPESYVSDEDILTHWQTLSADEGPAITYSTLFKFANLLQFKWPKEQFKRGKPTGRPMVNEVINFKYLLNYYGLKITREPATQLLYVSGDQTVLENYFVIPQITDFFFGRVGPFTDEHLIGVLHIFAQANKYDNIPKGSVSPIIKTILQHVPPQKSILHDWVLTKYEDLPENFKEPGTDPANSTLDFIMSCFTFQDDQDLKLARKQFKAFFSGIMMPIYNPKRIFANHNFMLILTGPENCRKTTFFQQLLPPILGNQLIATSVETLGSDKSLRDFQIKLASGALLVIDEFEIFYNRKNDSHFKSLVTASHVDFVPIYAKQSIRQERQAALAGTTNKTHLPMEQDGSRRIALVKVLFVDTSKLMKVRWHTFYRGITLDGLRFMKQWQQTGKGLFPWQLSKSDIGLQYAANEESRAQTDLEIVLRELFNFNAPFPGLKVITSVQTDKRWLWKITELRNHIEHEGKLDVSPSYLKNVLLKMCGKWTKTALQAQQLPNTISKATIKNGCIKQGQYTRWFMPPRIVEFPSETEEDLK